jgi:hypothetical protein
VHAREGLYVALSLYRRAAWEYEEKVIANAESHSQTELPKGIDAAYRARGEEVWRLDLTVAANVVLLLNSFYILETHFLNLIEDMECAHGLQVLSSSNWTRGKERRKKLKQEVIRSFMASTSESCDVLRAILELRGKAVHDAFLFTHYFLEDAPGEVRFTLSRTDWEDYDNPAVTSFKLEKAYYEFESLLAWYRDELLRAMGK